MKYALLIYSSPEARDIPEGQLQSVVREYEALSDQSGVLDGMQLQGTVNRAIGVAEATEPAAGLALLDRLDLDGYQYFHSTRAELLRRLDRLDEARTAFERALELATAEPERRFLRGRIQEVGGTAT